MRLLKELVDYSLRIIVLSGLIFLLLWFIGHHSGKIFAIYLPPQTFEQSRLLIDRIVSCKKLNAVIVDYEDPIRDQVLAAAKKAKLYTIVRMVVFPQGATWEQVNDQERILEIFEKSEELTRNKYVDEIQLDYIRFKDDRIRDIYKAEYIARLVTHIRKVNLWKKLSIDIFGRVAEGEDDVVGQSIVRLEQQIDVICPMLYPSHYGLHPEKRKDPYGTIYDGVIKVKEQLNFQGVTVRPYLQAFKLRLEGIPYDKYIRLQVLAAEKVGYGYSFWNTEGKYETVFEVLDEMFDQSKY